MADVKISGLPASTTPLAGTEVLPIVQGGQTRQVSVANLTAARATSALSFTSTNDSFISGLRIGKGAGAISGNTVVGSNALISNTTGGANTAVGDQALILNTTGGNNTGIGYIALYANSTGANNTAIGLNALSSNTTASANTAIGVRSLNVKTTGANNTAIGYEAGSTATTGANNGFFGYNAQPSSVTVSNEYTYGDANVTKHRFVGGDIVIGTAGNGIDFSADPSAAGMTSELLDDYEEGTWTPSDNSGATLTITVGHAVYTKVGRLVTVNAEITYPVTASILNARINLPLVSAFYDLGLANATTGNVYNLISIGGTNAFEFRNASLVRQTNASLSGAGILFTFSYTV